MPGPIRVLIVDDHQIVREGLRTLLAEEADIQVVGEAADGAEGVALTSVLRPDVVLMDLVMPNVDGIEAMRRLQQTDSASRVLVLTSFAEDGLVPEALRVGAVGYLLKDVLKAELIQAIQAAAKGEPYLHPEAQRRLIQQTITPPQPSPTFDLTRREYEVLRLISQGRSNKEIARELRIKEGTVKGHVSTILAKLGVLDRTQAALFAVQHGLGDPKR
ncbi:MAG TPA: response regulator transcription factor [Nitrospiraceae bacterium]|nr:response regulator transcription factor [Nitrospiraceae bacterium]